MKFKYFTNKDTGHSLAVNPDTVKYVKDVPVGTTLVFYDGEYIVVTDGYMEVATRLSEV
jgi:uncharacterized protein YlzI (FlbEa/FlbD family)